MAKKENLMGIAVIGVGIAGAGAYLIWNALSASAGRVAINLITGWNNIAIPDGWNDMASTLCVYPEFDTVSYSSLGNDVYDFNFICPTDTGPGSPARLDFALVTGMVVYMYANAPVTIP